MSSREQDGKSQANIYPLLWLNICNIHQLVYRWQAVLKCHSGLVECHYFSISSLWWFASVWGCVCARRVVRWCVCMWGGMLLCVCACARVRWCVCVWCGLLVCVRVCVKERWLASVCVCEREWGGLLECFASVFALTVACGWRWWPRCARLADALVRVGRSLGSGTLVRSGRTTRVGCGRG